MSLLSRIVKVVRFTIIRAEAEKQQLDARYDALRLQIIACTTVQQTHNMLDAIMDFREDCRKAGMPKGSFKSLYRLLQCQTAAIVNKL